MSSADEARKAIEATKSQIDEVVTQLQSLGAESMAAQASNLKQLAETAQTMVDPVKEKLNELIQAAQALKD